MQQLQPGTTLQGGKYKIEKMLGQGGFGISYLALNTMLDGKVAVKEFFFKDFCDRDEATSNVTLGTSGNRELVERFKQKFIKEARTIFKLNHPNIVRILDIFEENATAYYVMEYIEGESLGDMVKRRGAIPETEAVEYIREVASALSYIHSKNMNHLDIKPGNIMKRQEDGQVLVIDFGVAKQYDAVTSEGTTTTPVGISHGYSPAEQYRKNGVQTFSPQSDVYALAAMLYKLLTGQTPPEAMEVQDEGLPVDDLNAHGVSSAVKSAIVAAMRSRSVRTQSVEAFVAGLAATDTEEVEGDVEATVVPAETQQRLDAERKVHEEAERQRKTEAEAAARAAAERKASEEAARRQAEADDSATQLTGQQPSGSKKKGLWIALIVVVLAGTVLAAISLDTGIKHCTTIKKSEKSNRSLSEILQELSENMVFVQGNTFTMGNTSNRGSDADNDEKPMHNVTISNFHMCKYEVTQELWEAVMGNNPSYFKGAKKPVEQVSWNDCKTFITKLDSLTGKLFRLPTEAEWEYAARGGCKSCLYKYSGSNDLKSVAWYINNSGSTTHDVGTRQPNELGLYDMSGNVWEWCSDWYGSYSNNTLINPKGPKNGVYRVIRGGGWYGTDKHCRPSYRFCRTPGFNSNFLGLRLALSE